jgi:hypothetical protein
VERRSIGSGWSGWRVGNDGNDCWSASDSAASVTSWDGDEQVDLGVITARAIRTRSSRRVRCDVFKRAPKSTAFAFEGAHVVGAYAEAEVSEARKTAAAVEDPPLALAEKATPLPLTFFTTDRRTHAIRFEVVFSRASPHSSLTNFRFNGYQSAWSTSGSTFILMYSCRCHA